MKILEALTKLKDYHPKDRWFTTSEEVDHITKTLGLDEATDDDLINIRDMCVMLWGNQEFDDMRKEMDNMYAMNSITAVIDLHKSRRRMEV